MVPAINNHEKNIIIIIINPPPPPHRALSLYIIYIYVGVGTYIYNIIHNSIPIMVGMVGRYPPRAVFQFEIKQREYMCV